MTQSDEFADQCIVALKKAKDSSPTNWGWPSVREVIRQQHALSVLRKVPRAPKSARPRNPLFDAMALACGYSLERITRSAAGAIGKSVAEIAQVHSDLTPAEITRIAGKIRAKYDKAGPVAISAHWGEFTGHRTARANHDPYIEPTSWRSLALKKYPDALGWANPHDFKNMDWRDIALTLRQELVRDLAR